MTAFKVQLLTSPGIRKDDKDEQELSEDAVGFTNVNDYAVLWVADGAPGTKIKLNELNFSSRILAQYMGKCFEEVVLKDEIIKKPLGEEFLEIFLCELREQLSAKLKNLNKNVTIQPLIKKYVLEQNASILRLITALP